MNETESVVMSIVDHGVYKIIHMKNGLVLRMNTPHSVSVGKRMHCVFQYDGTHAVIKSVLSIV